MSLKSKSVDEVWVDKNGNRIPISSMSEEYAKNCLRLVIRRQRAAVEAEFQRRFGKMLRQQESAFEFINY